MSFVDVMNAQSEWTYEIITASADLGEVIREDAITSVNLTSINKASKDQNLGLSTTSLQGSRLEDEIGGDWIWSMDGSIRIVQAKKLDYVGRYPGYQIDTLQHSKILPAADAGYFGTQTAHSVYVFYNGFLDGTPADIGCIFIAANVLAEYIIGKEKSQQKSVFFSPKQLEDLGAMPWRYIFQ